MTSYIGPFQNTLSPHLPVDSFGNIHPLANIPQIPVPNNNIQLNSQTNFTLPQHLTPFCSVNSLPPQQVLNQLPGIDRIQMQSNISNFPMVKIGGGIGLSINYNGSTTGNGGINFFNQNYPMNPMHTVNPNLLNAGVLRQLRRLSNPEESSEEAGIITTTLPMGPYTTTDSAYYGSFNENQLAFTTLPQIPPSLPIQFLTHPPSSQNNIQFNIPVDNYQARPQTYGGEEAHNWRENLVQTQTAICSEEQNVTNYCVAISTVPFPQTGCAFRYCHSQTQTSETNGLSPFDNHLPLTHGSMNEGSRDRQEGMNLNVNMNMNMNMNMNGIGNVNGFADASGCLINPFSPSLVPAGYSQSWNEWACAGPHHFNPPNPLQNNQILPYHPHSPQNNTFCPPNLHLQTHNQRKF